MIAQELRDGHDHAGLAVPALRDVEGDPRPLDGVVAVLGQALDRGDLLSADRSDGQDARARLLPVDVHGAGAARRDPAPELRAGQPEVLAHDPQERNVVGSIELAGLAIDEELHGH